MMPGDKKKKGWDNILDPDWWVTNKGPNAGGGQTVPGPAPRPSSSRSSSQQGRYPGWYQPNRGGRVGSPSLAGYTSPVSNVGRDLADEDKMRTVGLNRGSITDTEPGLSMEDMMAMLYGYDQPGGSPGPGSSGSGSRGRSGAGGGYGANPDPLGWNAIAQVQALQTGYGNMLDALKAAAAAQSGTFDRSTAAINAGAEQARARQAQIVADLVNMSGQAAGRVGGVYGSANQDLVGLMDAYQRASQDRVGAAGNTLQAFGADPGLAAPGGSSTADFLAAQGAALARSRAADQGLLAGRQDVYGALGQDFAQRSEAWSQQQLAQVLAARQQAEAAAAREQAQLALELELKKLELQQQEQARRAQYGG